MKGYVGRALSMLALVALAVVVLLIQWVAENPGWAMCAALVLAFLVWCGIKGKEQRLRKIRDDAHVPSMSPLEYERYTARLLHRAGWRVWHNGQTGDQGCDVRAKLNGFRLVVQCKLYRRRCGNAAVQEIVAARRHYGAQLAAVVCPAGYTRAAQQLAQSNGVYLLHHDQLADLARMARVIAASPDRLPRRRPTPPTGSRERIEPAFDGQPSPPLR